MTDQQSDAVEIPENWDSMTPEEQDAWVTAALTRIFAGE